MAGVRSVGVRMWIKPWEPSDCACVLTTPAQLMVLLVVIPSVECLSFWVFFFKVL